MENIIVVTSGGLVQDVLNLPADLDYVIVDRDEVDECYTHKGDLVFLDGTVERIGINTHSIFMVDLLPAVHATEVREHGPMISLENVETVEEGAPEIEGIDWEQIQAKVLMILRAPPFEFEEEELSKALNITAAAEVSQDERDSEIVDALWEESKRTSTSRGLFQ